MHAFKRQPSIGAVATLAGVSSDTRGESRDSPFAVFEDDVYDMWEM